MAELILGAAGADAAGERRLIDATAPGARGGLATTSGGFAPRTLEVESAAVVLTGSGRWQAADQTWPLRRGDSVYTPPGWAHQWTADSAKTCLLIVHGASAEPADGRITQRLDGAEHGSAVDGSVDMGVRWLVTTETVGASQIVVATSTFTPGGSHDLHRHPNADEFFLVVDGGGEHLTADGPIRVGADDLVVIPAGEWHGFRTDPGVTTRTVYGYLGAGSLQQAGHELRAREVAA